MRDQGGARASRRFERVLVLSVAVAAVIASAAYLIWKVGGIGNGSCGQAIGAAQQGAIVGSCVLAFAAGHWAQRFRREDPRYTRALGQPPVADEITPGRFRTLRRVTRYLRTGLPTRSTAWKTGSLITYGVLVIFYACGLLAIAYETYAIWPGTNVAPITSLVRCARNADVGWTIVVAGTVSFLVGHWLWPPRESGEDGNA